MYLKYARGIFLLLVLSAFNTIVSAHFVLQLPVSLEYIDVCEASAPCDTFDPTNRSTGVIDWPLGGYPVLVLTTHPNVTWEINAALLSDVTTWAPLVPVLHQVGVGYFCEPQIPGKAEWVGKEAVFQMAQHAPDGVLYQVCFYFKSTFKQAISLMYAFSVQPSDLSRV